MPLRTARSLAVCTAALSAVLAVAASAAGGGYGPLFRVSAANEPAFFSSSAIDARGDAVVVWNRQPAHGAGQLRAVYLRTGHYGAEQVVGRYDQPGGGLPPSKPQVAIDPHGHAIAIWTRKDSKGKLRAVVSRTGASGRFGRVSVLSPAGQAAGEPSVAIDAGDRVMAVWTGLDSRGSLRTEARYARPGHGFGPTQLLSGTAQQAQTPDVGLDSHGHAVAVWAYGGITQVIQVARASGSGRFGRAQTLSNAALYASQPEVAVAPSGRAMVVWEQSGQASLASAVAAASSPAHGNFGKPQVLEDGNTLAINPHVAGDARGRMTALWEDAPIAATGRSRILAAASAPGRRFGRARTLDSATGGSSFQRPAIAVDAQGHAFTAWERLSTHVSPVRGAVRSSPVGPFGSAGNLSKHSGAFASVAAAGSGQAIATWDIAVGSSSSAGIDARFGR